MTKICPECQTLNSDSDKFCKNCGVNLNTVNVTKKETQKSWINTLFFWKAPTGYRIAKSKIVFWIVFLITFFYCEYFYFFVDTAKPGVFISIFAGIIVALIFSVPVFAAGFLIHYIMERG